METLGNGRLVLNGSVLTDALGFISTQDYGFTEAFLGLKTLPQSTDLARWMPIVIRTVTA